MTMGTKMYIKGEMLQHELDTISRQSIRGGKQLPHIEKLKERIENGGFKHYMLNFNKNIQVAELESVEFEVYKGTLILRINGIDRSPRLAPHKYSTRYDLTNAFEIEDKKSTLTFKAKPWVIGDYKISTIVLSKKTLYA